MYAWTCRRVASNEPQAIFIRRCRCTGKVRASFFCLAPVSSSQNHFGELGIATYTRITKV